MSKASEWAGMTIKMFLSFETIKFRVTTDDGHLLIDAEGTDYHLSVEEALKLRDWLTEMFEG